MNTGLAAQRLVLNDGFRHLANSRYHNNVFKTYMYQYVEDIYLICYGLYLQTALYTIGRYVLLLYLCCM